MPQVLGSVSFLDKDEISEADGIKKSFLAIIARHSELKSYFTFPPSTPHQQRKISKKYKEIIEAFNQGNIALTGFKMPPENEKLPIRFTKLAQVIAELEKEPNVRQAWNYLHGFLQEYGIIGIYEEPEYPASVDTILRGVQGLVDILSEEKKMSSTFFASMNTELRNLNTALGNTNRGLKSSEEGKELFEQLMERMLSTDKKIQEDVFVAAHLRKIVGHLQLLDNKGE